MTEEFEAIGTHWHVSIEASDAPALMARARERIEAFDRDYSRFRADSLVSRMAQAAGTYRLPEDAKPLLDLYFELNDATEGAFTPLIGRTLSDAGYDDRYSLRPGALSPVPPLSQVLAYRYSELTLKEPALLDFGAVGKGYLVDLVAALLRGGGARQGLVDAGGDIAAWGAPARVGLEDPQDPARVIGVADIAGRSICGSAGNRRAWEGFTHIIDPRTLASPAHISAIWTVAGTTLLADALSTCLYFVPPERLARYPFEYLILRPDYSVESSAGFPAELFFD